MFTTQRIFWFFIYLEHTALGFINESNYTCHHGILCHPKDYDPSEMPSAGVKVYVNIRQDNALKKVDDKEMVLTFKPVVVLVWKDPRMRVIKQLKLRKPQFLPDTMLSKIWYTKLTVANRIMREDTDTDLGAQSESLKFSTFL